MSAINRAGLGSALRRSRGQRRPRRTVVPETVDPLIRGQGFQIQPRAWPRWEDDAEAARGYRWNAKGTCPPGPNRGELMVKMTEEQRVEGAAKRRRPQAEAAEARELQREVKRREWVEKGMYLTYEEMMAGIACRACGESLWDGKGKPFVPINNRTEDEQCEIEEAEAKFGERHPDCREGNWRIQGCRRCTATFAARRHRCPRLSATRSGAYSRRWSPR